jgi:hypothetical protein
MAIGVPPPEGTRGLAVQYGGAVRTEIIACYPGKVAGIDLAASHLWGYSSGEDCADEVP